MPMKDEICVKMDLLQITENETLHRIGQARLVI